MTEQHPEPAPVTREPWQRIFDVVMIAGVAVLLWNVVVVAGWVPGQTFLLLAAYTTLDLGSKDWTFLIGLTLAGLAEIPAYYVVLSSRRSNQTRLAPGAGSTWLILRLFFALMPWVYLLVLYLCPPNGK